MKPTDNDKSRIYGVGKDRIQTRVMVCCEKCLTALPATEDKLYRTNAEGGDIWVLMVGECTKCKIHKKD